MIIQVLLRLHSIHAQLTLDGRISENICSILLIKNIVGDMLNDCCCLLVVDQLRSLCDEFLRIILKLVKYKRLYSLKNCNNRFTCQPCFIYQFTDKVIFNIRVSSNSYTVASGFFFHKGGSCHQVFF